MGSLEGGGICNCGNDNTLTLTNSTVSGNTAAFGGAIFNHLGNTTLTNSTVSGNTATAQGGGIHDTGTGGSVDLLNSIIAGNTVSGNASDCSGILTSLGHNLSSDGTCGLSLASGDLLNTDPLLGPLGLRNNGGPTLTVALLPGSAAIDTGDDSVLGSPHNLANDQRGAGFPRLQGAHVDIGAFEATPPNTPPVADPQTVDTTQDTPVPITLTGSDADAANVLSFKISRLPNSGDLSDGTPVAAPRGIAGDTVTYTPNAGVTGTDSFEFVANDGTADSAAATVTVNINAPPPGPPALPRMPSLQQQFDILSGDDVPPELAHSAISQLPGMLLGTPVVLPTSGGAAGAVTMETWMETIRFFNRVDQDLRDAIDSLRDVKLGTAARPPHPDPSVKGPRQPGQCPPGGDPERGPRSGPPGGGGRPDGYHPSLPEDREGEDRGTLPAAGAREIWPLPHREGGGVQREEQGEQRRWHQ